MRIYNNPKEAFREVERDLFEMGILVHPQTMQDKDVADNPDYITQELSPYTFQINGWRHNTPEEEEAVRYIMAPRNTTIVSNGEATQVLRYINAEFYDRISGTAMNPGNAWKTRETLWREFMHDGKFAYTYSERMAPQLQRILSELRIRPETRQGIINIHSNIQPEQLSAVTNYYPPNTARRPEDQQIQNVVMPSADWHNMGGNGRIPCSLHYQVLRRKEAVDLIYSMRSCDFLTHFPVDVMLAFRLQTWFADQLQTGVGRFTYFTGSMHAYHKDMKQRGIF